MQSEPQSNFSGKPFKRGQSSRTVKLARIAAKADELRAVYFPDGGMNVMDANRLQLAAQHYVDAERCRDPVTRQRATRIAEFLLSKIKRPEQAVPSISELGL